MGTKYLRLASISVILRDDVTLRLISYHRPKRSQVSAVGVSKHRAKGCIRTHYFEVPGIVRTGVLVNVWVYDIWYLVFIGSIYTSYGHRVTKPGIYYRNTGVYCVVMRPCVCFRIAYEAEARFPQSACRRAHRVEYLVNENIWHYRVVYDAGTWWRKVPLASYRDRMM